MGYIMDKRKQITFKRKIGRPTKLTKQLKNRLFKALKSGISYETACEFAGISPSTFYKWVNEGERDKENNYRTEFSEFLEDLKKANASVEMHLIQQVANDPSWQSKAWILERRLRDKWGRKEKVDGEIKHDHRHTVNKREEVLYKFYANLEVEELEDLLQLMNEIDRNRK